MGFTCGLNCFGFVRSIGHPWTDDTNVTVPDGLCSRIWSFSRSHDEWVAGLDVWEKDVGDGGFKFLPGSVSL